MVFLTPSSHFTDERRVSRCCNLPPRAQQNHLNCQWFCLWNFGCHVVIWIVNKRVPKWRLLQLQKVSCSQHHHAFGRLCLEKNVRERTDGVWQESDNLQQCDAVAQMWVIDKMRVAVWHSVQSCNWTQNGLVWECCMHKCATGMSTWKRQIMTCALNWMTKSHCPHKILQPRKCFKRECLGKICLQHFCVHVNMFCQNHRTAPTEWRNLRHIRSQRQWTMWKKCPTFLRNKTEPMLCNQNCQQHAFLGSSLETATRLTPQIPSPPGHLSACIQPPGIVLFMLLAGTQQHHNNCKMPVLKLPCWLWQQRFWSFCCTIANRDTLIPHAEKWISKNSLTGCGGCKTKHGKKSNLIKTMSQRQCQQKTEKSKQWLWNCDTTISSTLQNHFSGFEKALCWRAKILLYFSQREINMSYTHYYCLTPEN